MTITVECGKCGTELTVRVQLRSVMTTDAVFVVTPCQKCAYREAAKAHAQGFKEGKAQAQDEAHGDQEQGGGQ